MKNKVIYGSPVELENLRLLIQALVWNERLIHEGPERYQEASLGLIKAFNLAFARKQSAEFSVPVNAMIQEDMHELIQALEDRYHAASKAKYWTIIEHNESLGILEDFLADVWYHLQPHFLERREKIRELQFHRSGKIMKETLARSSTL